MLKYQLSSNYQSFYIDVLVCDFRQDIRLKFDQKIIRGEKAQIWINAHKKKNII